METAALLPQLVCLLGLVCSLSFEDCFFGVVVGAIVSIVYGASELVEAPGVCVSTSSWVMVSVFFFGWPWKSTGVPGKGFLTGSSSSLEVRTSAW